MKIASYNIMSGGFNTYTNTNVYPERLKLLKSSLKLINADFVGLIDTFRWKDIYTEDDLQKIYGYKYSSHIDMNDDRVDKKIGLTILTNLENVTSKSIKIYNRDCIKSTIPTKSGLIEIFTIYLDDINENTRKKEISKIINNITAQSVIIMGDFNCITRKDVDLLKEEWNLFIKANPKVLQKDNYKNYVIPAINELFKANALNLMDSNKFTEALAQNTLNPTAFTSLNINFNTKPIFRLDHIFYKGNISIKNFKVWSGEQFEKASDHFPISGIVL